jgi:hypothetical protein
MDLNFEYVSLYGMSRSVTKVCMILICIFFSYDFCKLCVRLSLMLFIAPLMNLFCNHMCTLGLCLVE